MKTIIMPRNTGKTTALIKLSSKNNIPIGCWNARATEYIKEKANEMGLKIPEPFVAFRIILFGINGTLTCGEPLSFSSNVPARGEGGFYLDDIDLILQRLLGKMPEIITATDESLMEELYGE